VGEGESGRGGEGARGYREEQAIGKERAMGYREERKAQ